MTWEAINSGLPSRRTSSLAINDSGFVFIGSQEWVCKSNFTTNIELKITQPNGGEIWQVGSTQNITWTSTNVTNVKLEYTTNNGTNWTTIIASIAASTGTFSWTIPNTVSNECLVKISDVDNLNIFDVSDTTFEIHAMPFWQFSGLGGSSINALAVSLTGDIYAGDNQNGLWRNHGSGWNLVNTAGGGTQPNRVNAITVNPQGEIFAAYEDRVWYSTNNGINWATRGGSIYNPVSVMVSNSLGIIFAGHGGGLERSSDYGNTWQPLGSSVGATYALTFDTLNRLYAGTDLGSIYRSTNNGDTWTLFPNIPQNVGLISSILLFNNSIFAATGNSGVLKSTDDGQTWSTKTNGLSGNSLSVNALIADGSTIYSGTGGGTFFSTDFGETWEKNNVGMTEPIIIIEMTKDNAGYLYAGGVGGVYRSISPIGYSNIDLSHPNGGENLIVGSVDTIRWTSNNVATVKLEYTTNNGSSWIDIITSTPAAIGSYSWTIPNTPSTKCKIRISDAINSSTADTSNSFFYIVSPNGWTIYNAGVNYELESVFFISDSIGWVCGNGGILKTTNGGQNWIEQYSNINYNLMSICFINSDIGYAVGFGGIILHTTNGGTSWINQTGVTSFNLYSVKFSSNNIGWIVGESGLVLKTIDGGQNWITQNSGVSGYLTSISMYNDSIAIAVGGAGVIIKTTDGGITWIDKTGITTSYLGGIFIYDLSNIWAVGQFGNLFKSTDSGNSWIVLNSTTDKTLRSVQFLSSNSGWICGSEGTLLKTDDGGNTWSNELSGFTDCLNSIFFRTLKFGWSVGCYGTILKYVNNSIIESITLTLPNGGESWQVGTTQNITWMSSNVANVKLEYTTDNGTNWSNIIASTPASSGSYGWTVPNTPSTNCKVRVLDSDNSAIGDTSDNVFTISGFEQFTEQTIISLTGINNCAAAWGDYDNDGDLDILLTGGTQPSGETSKIYRNDGNNSFIEQTSIALTGVSHSSTAWGDYDNDGDLDIILSGWTGTSRTTKIYHNNGDNTFTEQTSIILAQVEESNIVWGDYDNDGDLDVLLTGGTGSSYISKIYSNNGDNSFTEQTTISLTGTDGDVAWGDYDNDGDLDILLTGFTGSGNVSKIYRNDGNKTFTEQTTIVLSAVKLSSVAWGDYDNDGDLDILLSGQGNSEFVSKIYKNNGNNTFSVQTGISLIGLRGSSATWGDYDNDGDLDILLAGSTSYPNEIPTTKLYRNNGDNTFTEQTSISLASVLAPSIAWGDYDNDGDLDILLTGYIGNSSSISKIYRNNNTVSNTIPTLPINLVSSVNGQDITFRWDRSLDNETPQKGLKYNLVIGTSPGDFNRLSPMSDRSTGYRRIISMGNANHDTSWTIKGLPQGTYYWSVQAIDNNFAGSNFATEQSFTITGTTPTVTVTAPNGSESWQVGKSYSITWTDNINENVKIELYKGDVFNSIITASTTSNGNYSWTIPTNQTTGSDYKIRITSVNTDTISDFSDNNFTIDPVPFITVTSPDGGQSWQVGTSQSITWTDNISDNVKIDLYKGGTLNSSIVNSTPSTGSYSWLIPTNQTTANDYKVRITSVTTDTLYDMSDNNFTITPIPSITVTSPSGGENWRAGTIHTISWNSVSVLNVKIEYTTNSGTDWNLVVNNYTNTGSYSWTVPTISSTTCQIRVSDAQTASVTNTSPAVSVFIYPTTISATTTITFGAITDISNYRMISLPGLSNKKVSDLLSGEHPYDWNVYWDNGLATDYQVQYDGSSTFNFKPGNAFWILSKNPFSISQDVNNVPLYDDNNYKIDVHNGWNIISNPYDKKVSWTQVQQSNSLPSNSIIYLWEGTYSQPTEMEKYKGYYFNNIFGKDSLIIPYDPYALGKKLSKENMFHKSAKELMLSLTYKDEIKSYIKLGIDSSASMDFDTLDYFAPPGDFEKYSIKLVNEKLDVRDKYLFIENRPEIGEGQIFDLEIKSVPSEKIEIKLEGQQNFGDYQIYLLDCRLNRLKDIKNQSILSLSLQHQYNTYKLLIGSESFIENVKKDLVPQQYYLYQNYPNPANPNTFIQYDLPQNTSVKLKIYDILGTEVETLVNAEQESGRYEVLFNAEKYASGVYLYRLETESFTAVKKMILLR